MCSTLRTFTAQPDETPLILGLRRPPPFTLVPSLANHDTQVAICTSVGFRIQKIADYVSGALTLGPDVVIGAADLVFSKDSSGVPGAAGKGRTQKMVERTGAWTNNILNETLKAARSGQSVPAVFAPVLPIPFEPQRMYILELVSHVQDSATTGLNVAGLALHSSNVLESLPPELLHLPILSLDSPKSPIEILHQIARGVDVLTVPFLNTATDAGIALTFEFPAPSYISSQIEKVARPLGIDLWDTAHAAAPLPLTPACTCFACTSHHRAYIHHLLSAKEMLGWTLLAIHNHHILAQFFASIRHLLSTSPDTFLAEVARFEQVYERGIPESIMGKGPRVRGYQYKSEKAQVKKNEASYSRLEKTKRSKGEDVPVEDGKIIEVREDRDILEQGRDLIG
jgi:queuine tRNA-ribosyltransferase accessory subunit